MFYISAEDTLTARFGFRVTPNGNRKVEFVNRIVSANVDVDDGEVETIKFIGFATRPATQQECIMWDWLVHIQAETRYSEPVPELKNEQQA